MDELEGITNGNGPFELSVVITYLQNRIEDLDKRVEILEAKKIIEQSQVHI